MVERWNSVVRPHDRVLHLGDLYFWRGNGPQKFARHVAPRLNGAKFLVMGNHDRDDPEVYESLGFQVVEPFALEIDGVKVSFDHYPYPHDQDPEGLHIHGHIHNNGYPITADWRDGTVPTRPNQINVSVEMLDYTPVRLRSLLSPRCPSVSEAPEESKEAQCPIDSMEANVDPPDRTPDLYRSLLDRCPHGCKSGYDCRGHRKWK